MAGKLGRPRKGLASAAEKGAFVASPTTLREFEKNLNARLPKRLVQRLKSYCAEKDIEIREVIWGLVESKLRQEGFWTNEDDDVLQSQGFGKGSWG